MHKTCEKVILSSMLFYVESWDSKMKISQNARFFMFLKFPNIFETFRFPPWYERMSHFFKYKDLGTQWEFMKNFYPKTVSNKTTHFYNAFEYRFIFVHLNEMFLQLSCEVYDADSEEDDLFY